MSNPLQMLDSFAKKPWGRARYWYHLGWLHLLADKHLAVVILAALVEGVLSNRFQPQRNWSHYSKASKGKLPEELWKDLFQQEKDGSPSRFLVLRNRAIHSGTALHKDWTKELSEDERLTITGEDASFVWGVCKKVLNWHMSQG